MCPIDTRTPSEVAFPDFHTALCLARETRDSERFAALGVAVSHDMDATLIEMDQEFDAYVASKVPRETKKQIDL
jgi:hypothetical protein